MKNNTVIGYMILGPCWEGMDCNTYAVGNEYNVNNDLMVFVTLNDIMVMDNIPLCKVVEVEVYDYGKDGDSYYAKEFRIVREVKVNKGIRSV